MKYCNVLFVLFFSVLTSCSVSTASSEKPTKASLEKAINTFNQAFSNGNVPKLITMISDEYRHTNGSAKAIDARSWLNYLHKRSADIRSKELIVNSYEMDQIDIVMYGTSAIVTGRVKTSSTYQENTRESEFRVTHLWIFENERWKRAGFHDGKIK